MLYDAKTPFRSMVDAKNGTAARQIFNDQSIYQLELERIFARAWNFMCHESMVPNPGDFFLSYIGEESVICVRDKKGGFQVFLNSCRHRGNAVCRAEQGNTRSFLCTYHGWTYDLEGKLIGVPGYKDLYHEQLDRSQWGLVSAGKVQNYKGFIFATMDENAPDLEEYLGPVGTYALDIASSRGTMQAVNGVQKNQIGCNWKLAVDNLYDWYHVDISHASSQLSGYGRRPGMPAPNPNARLEHRVLMGAYGHGVGGPRMTPQSWEQMEKYVSEATAEGKTVEPLFNELWRREGVVGETLGDLVDTRGHHNIFPNLWILASGHQLCLRLPKGPTTTELWWFTLVPEEFTEEQRNPWVYRANHTFGPAGMLEQDDGENWDQSTRAMGGPIAQRYPINFQMHLGLGEVKVSSRGASFVDANISEHGQLWTYRAWADWMDAESWDALKRDHTRPPAAGERV